MTDSDAEPSPLEELLREALEHSGAERVECLDALCAQHPEQADELRARIALVDSFLGASAVPERLGEFRLEERIGGGGMGVVYRAEQTSLGRRVALKLIRPEHLYFPSARARFQRETEAIASLQHPGIITIHTVGEEDGVPYFAMELLEGRTLSQVLKELLGCAPESASWSDMFGPAPGTAGDTGRSWVDACLTVVLRVAEALEHAHAKGLLHRDVKPSNVMVVPGDEPRIVLFDFGLTGALDGEVDVEQRTRTGAQIGTLAYMSPEQVEGLRSIDARTDVYSLGVTLYELLTLQTPYRGESRTALQESILRGGADSIRPRNPRVPEDVETVCAVAMSALAGDRYSDMGAFARDLRNCLERRPIEARPPSARVRAVRWVQRHPARTAAIAATTLLVLGLPTSLLVQEQRYSGQLEGALANEKAAKVAAQAAESQARDAEREARSAEHEASTARDQAQARFEESEAVLAYFLGLFDIAGRESASSEISIKELLDRGVERVDDHFLDQPATRARLLVAIAQTYSNLDHFDEALPFAEEALRTFRETPPDRPELLAQALMAVGSVLGQRGEMEAGEMALREAVEILEPMISTQRIPLAHALTALAMNRLSVGRSVGDECVQLLVRVEKLVRESEDEFDPAFLAELLTNRGFVELSFGDPKLSRGLLEESIALFDELSDRTLIARASAYNAMGMLCYSEGKAEAIEWHRRAIEAANASYGPESTLTRGYQVNYAVELDRIGRTAEAEVELLEALAVFERKKPRSNPDFVRAEAWLSGIMVKLGHFEEIVTRYEDVLPEMGSSWLPGNFEFAFIERDLASAYDHFGRGAEAAALRVSSAKKLRTVATAEIHVTPLLASAGRYYIDADEFDPAEDALELAFEVLREFPSLRLDTATLENLAWTAELLGRADDAVSLRATGRPPSD